MRSSNKSRSRNKGSNRSRNVGNVVNRVFDSAGPEGRVRGTPAQIIEKYQALARDAQLANDRVAAENFQQHAEHYLRLLNEALREQAEQRQQQDQQRGRSNPGQPNGHGDDDEDQPDYEDRAEAPRDSRGRDGGERPAPDVFETDADSSLVDTPESRADAPAQHPQEQQQAPRKSRGRPRRSSKASADEQNPQTVEGQPIQ